MAYNNKLTLEKLPDTINTAAEQNGKSVRWPDFVSAMAAGISINEMAAMFGVQWVTMRNWRKVYQQKA